MCTVKDSFAANKVNQILPDVHNSDEYVFVSLDIFLLFTNVPLKKIVDIILKHFILARKLQQYLWSTYICQKTALSFVGKMYEKICGVSTEGSLGLVLANIIMTEYEKVIFNQ